MLHDDTNIHAFLLQTFLDVPAQIPERPPMAKCPLGQPSHLYQLLPARSVVAPPVAPVPAVGSLSNGLELVTSSRETPAAAVVAAAAAAAALVPAPAAGVAPLTEKPETSDATAFSPVVADPAAADMVVVAQVLSAEVEHQSKGTKPALVRLCHQTLWSFVLNDPLHQKALILYDDSSTRAFLLQTFLHLLVVWSVYVACVYVLSATAES